MKVYNARSSTFPYEHGNRASNNLNIHMPNIICLILLLTQYTYAKDIQMPKLHYRHYCLNTPPLKLAHEDLECPTCEEDTQIGIYPTP